VALKNANDQFGGTTKAMRERQRVEILRDRLAAQGFLSIANMAATTVAGPDTRVTEAA
jgi:hypothetical protein